MSGWSMLDAKLPNVVPVADHLNTFNMIVAQLTSMGVTISAEDHCMLLLCSLPNTWDHLVMAIESTTTSFKMEDVVSCLLSKEAPRKYSEMVKEALVVRGISKEKGKKKDMRSKSKSQGRSKSQGKNSKVRCSNCGKTVHF